MAVVMRRWMRVNFWTATSPVGGDRRFPALGVTFAGEFDERHHAFAHLRKSEFLRDTLATCVADGAGFL